MTTRFYLRNTAETVPISPSADAAWEDVSILARALTRTTKTSDAITTVAFTDANGSDRDINFRQYITPLPEGQTITGGQALKFQVRGIEDNLANNMFTALGIRVIASDGSTVRKTVLAVTRDDLELTGTTTNRQFTATSAATNYVTVNGDYLVIEIGTGGAPGATVRHNSSLSLGDANASDLPEDSTTTTALNPWVELTDTLTVGVSSAAGAAAATSSATGIGASTAAATGSASAAATVSGIGAAITAGAGSSSAISVAVGVGAATASGVGLAASTSAVSGIGAAIATAAGSAVITVTVTGVGSSSVGPVGTINMVCAAISVAPRIGGTPDGYVRIAGTPSNGPRIGGTPALEVC